MAPTMRNHAGRAAAVGRSGRSGNAGEEDDVTPLTAAELTSRLAEYSAFRNNVLAADLARLQLRQARLQEDAAEYEQLRANVAALLKEGKTSLESSVDVGCQVYCKALVPDTSRIYVAVGLGFMLECELAEVPAVTQPRLRHLASELDECGRKLEAVRLHMAQVDEAVEELARLGT